VCRALGVGSEDAYNTGGNMVDYFYSVQPECGRMPAGGNPASYMFHALATPIPNDATTPSATPSGPDSANQKAPGAADSASPPSSMVHVSEGESASHLKATTSDGESTASGAPMSTATSARNSDYWKHAYAASPMCAAERSRVQELLARAVSGGKVGRRSASSKRCRSLSYQLGALVTRWGRLLYRGTYSQKSMFLYIWAVELYCIRLLRIC
jgi:hypothetical protein